MTYVARVVQNGDTILYLASVYSTEKWCSQAYKQDMGTTPHLVLLHSNFYSPRKKARSTICNAVLFFVALSAEIVLLHPNFTEFAARYVSSVMMNQRHLCNG